MVSLGGKYLFNDDSFEISVKDVARHLGRVVRFGGAVGRYWSVLQHSLLVSDLVNQRNGTLLAHLASGDGNHLLSRLGLLALFHDAHEFITGDVPTPWKYPELTVRQKEIDVLIAHAIGLPRWTDEEHYILKIADELALKVEAHFVAPIVVKLRPDKFGTFAAVAQFENNMRRYCKHNSRWDWEACWKEDGLYVQLFEERALAYLERVNRP